MNDVMKCPKCESEDLNMYLVLSETMSDTIIAKCENCYHEITQGEVYGKSIFDKNAT